VQELLGALADWLGLDLRGRSIGRIIVIVALYTAAGLLLALAGFYLIAAYRDDPVSILSGLVCLALGVAFLIRIGVNVRALLRRPKA
jgi:hypothetical protein